MAVSCDGTFRCQEPALAAKPYQRPHARIVSVVRSRERFCKGGTCCSHVTMADPGFDRDVDFFRTIPWTRKLLEDPHYIPVPTPSRKYCKSRDSAIVAETLNTKDTIKAWLTLQKKPEPGRTLITETRNLFSLGSGLTGYEGLLHGGITTLMIDEAMGMILQLNAYARNGEITSLFVTAYLKTTFLRPIPTPSIISISAKLRERKGRKMYIDATVEDEAGEVLATAEALWLLLKEQQPKL